MNSASLIDHIIYRELKYAQGLRRDAMQYSRASLAEKFDMTRGVIDGILDGKDAEDPEDTRLIRECHEKAQQLWEELEEYTQAAIARRYGRTPNQVRRIARGITEGRATA